MLPFTSGLKLSIVRSKRRKKSCFGSGLMELRNHYYVCLYNRGQFTSVADPGEGNKAVDEYGRRLRYKFQVPECPRSIPMAKPVGFKEWAIHAGVDHHLVEKVMMEDSHSGHERGVDRGGEGPRRGGGGAGHWTAYHCPLERRYTTASSALAKTRMR